MCVCFISMHEYNSEYLCMYVYVCLRVRLLESHLGVLIAHSVQAGERSAHIVRAKPLRTGFHLRNQRCHQLPHLGLLAAEHPQALQAATQLGGAGRLRGCLHHRGERGDQLLRELVVAAQVAQVVETRPWVLSEAAATLLVQALSC